MTVATALLAFCLAAAVLTVTPGLDTILVVRTRLAAGRRPAVIAAAGIATGCFLWGVAVALGLGAVLKAAPLAYEALRWCGALYLLVCGLRLLIRPRGRLDVGETAMAPTPGLFFTALLTNLLNPKVGLFYLSFLPQFVPPAVPVASFMIGLAAIHAVMGLLWLSMLAQSVGLIRRFVLQPAALRWLDRTTGGVFIGFGLKLALDRS